MFKAVGNEAELLEYLIEPAHGTDPRLRCSARLQRDVFPVFDRAFLELIADERHSPTDVVAAVLNLVGSLVATTAARCAKPGHRADVYDGIVAALAEGLRAARDNVLAGEEVTR